MSMAASLFMTWEETQQYKDQLQENTDSIKQLILKEWKGLWEVKELKDAKKMLRTGYYFLV